MHRVWKPGDKFARNRTSQGVPPCALFRHHMEGYVGVVRRVHRSSITDTKGRKHGFIAIDPYEEDMAYERTKYFAMKLDPGRSDELPVMGETATKLRDTASMVKRDIEMMGISQGDRWMIFQTHSLLEAEPPRPPIRITEYK